MHIHRWTLSFQVWTRSLISCFGSSTWGERHNSYDANHPQCAVHLVIFKISVDRDQKNPTTSSTARIQLSIQWLRLNSLPPWSNSMVQFATLNSLFQNPQILRTISSGHDVIHTPVPFPVWGFIMTMVIVISFVHECKTAPIWLYTWTLNLNCSKPNQTEW